MCPLGVFAAAPPSRLCSPLQLDAYDDLGRKQAAEDGRVMIDLKRVSLCLVFRLFIGIRVDGSKVVYLDPFFSSS